MWTDEARARYKDDGRRDPGDLTDAEWQTIEPVLRGYATLTADLRGMVNACLSLERAGCPWRFLPKEVQAVADRAHLARPFPGRRHLD